MGIREEHGKARYSNIPGKEISNGTAVFHVVVPDVRFRRELQQPLVLSIALRSWYHTMLIMKTFGLIFSQLTYTIFCSTMVVTSPRLFMTDDAEITDKPARRLLATEKKRIF